MMHYNSNYKTIAIFLCIAVLFLFQSCERKKEPLAKPQVVSKKINLGSEGSSDAGGIEIRAASASVSEAEKSAIAQKIEKSENGEKQKAESDRGAPVEPGDKGGLLEAGPKGIADSASDVALEESPEEDDFNLLAGISKSPPVYDPADKIDPFRPLFRDEPDDNEPVAAEERQKTKKRIPRTPLERIGLSQLKLVGIIQAESGDKGLVQENSGKGYIISSGTYIGTNGGRVTEILKEKVIVEEEVEDVLGKPIIQKRELKLQKPFGEN